MAGRLCLDSARETYCDEAVVIMLEERIGHRKARTIAELLETIRESERGHEGLREDVRKALRQNE